MTRKFRQLRKDGRKLERRPYKALNKRDKKTLARWYIQEMTLYRLQLRTEVWKTMSNVLQLGSMKANTDIPTITSSK